MPSPVDTSRIEVVRCPLFPPGYILRVAHRTYLQVVDLLEHADGGVFLGGITDLAAASEGIIAFFFTYYVTHPRHEAVDHEATIQAIEWLTPEGIDSIARQVQADLRRRSLAAALCYNPFVSFFDKC